MRNYKVDTYGYIYLIRNLVNNKIYIGKKKNKSKNWKNDNYFGSGKILKLSIIKYGINNFTKQYLQFIYTNENDLCDREKYWIKKFKFKNKYVMYNLVDGGKGVPGLKRTQEAKDRQLISRWNTILKNSNEIIKLYNSGHTYKEIKEKVKVCSKSIRTILNNNNIKIRIKADYTRLNEEEILERKIARRKGRGHKIYSKEQRENISKRLKGNLYRGRIENIHQYDLDGNLIKIWGDSKEIVNFYNLINASPILRVLRGERKKYKNYIWKTQITNV